MTDRMSKPWTSREVHFTVDNTSVNDEDYERFQDALCDRFWGEFLKDGPRMFMARFFHITGISSRDRVHMVSGFPFWIPAWLARRMVAKVAMQSDIGGSATYMVERNVLKERWK